MTFPDGKDRPWDDGRDEIVIQKVVNPLERGHPFQVFYYSPGYGSGYLKFTASGIQIQPPGRKKVSGASLILPDLDGDLDLDAAELGCFFMGFAAAVFGKLVRRSWQRTHQDESRIAWQEELKKDRIESIGIQGQMLTIVHHQRGRRTFTIRVAREDRERLTEELSRHYPRAL